MWIKYLRYIQDFQKWKLKQDRLHKLHFLQLRTNN